MATTGTTAFSPDLSEMVEEAFARCGSELRSGWDFRTARMSANLMLLDWANRGINLWTVASSTISLVAGTATYTLPTDTVDLLDHVVRTGTGTSQADLTIARISEPVYAAIPTKNTTGRPSQVWVQRLTAPQITVWPVPDTAATYTFVYWYLRRIQDAGDAVNTQDIPFRFIPAFIAGLAYYLSMKVAGAGDRAQALQAQYEEALGRAMEEDREKATVRFVPRVMHM